MLLASFIWGITFVFQGQAADVIGPCMYNGIRMLLGVIVLQPLFIPIVKRHKGDKKYMKALLIGGLFCGLSLATASIFQQAGIAYTTAGKAGFITSLYTLIVPILSVLLKKKVSARTWVCVGIGLVGAFLLSININALTGANSEAAIGKGDILIFVCAVLFAVQIMVIDHYGPMVEGVDLSVMQFLVGGLFCLIIGIFAEPFEFSMVKAALVPILYAGICSCGIAYTLQIVGQKYVHPAKATLALSLESVWAAVGGAVLAGETMVFKEVLGCVLLFAAVVVSQMPERKKN